MLYSCDCSILNKNNNEYRINFIQYVQKYLETIIYLQNNILIILFEPGGLLDEYTALSLFFKKIKNTNINIIVTLYIIEHELYNTNIQDAHKYFVKLCQQYSFINIHFFTILRFRDLFYNNFQSIIIMSLDPYYFLSDYFFKNIHYDFSRLPTNIISFFFITLYVEKEAVFLDKYFINRLYYPDYFFLERHKGGPKEFYFEEKIQYSFLNLLE